MEKDGNVSNLESVKRLENDIANDLTKRHICVTEFNEEEREDGKTATKKEVYQKQS